MNGRYGVDRFAERMESHKLSSAKEEQRIIDKKRKDIALLDSRAFHCQSKEKRKEMEAQANSLPLECWGFVEYVVVKDVRNGMTHRVSKHRVDEFCDSHPRPNDLVIEQKDSSNLYSYKDVRAELLK